GSGSEAARRSSAPYAERTAENIKERRSPNLNVTIGSGKLRSQRSRQRRSVRRSIRRRSNMSRAKRTVLTCIAGPSLPAAPSFAFAEASNEWPHYGGDQSNTRYSGLSQINTGNVSTLHVVWMHSLGSLESQQSTPLVIGDSMYVTTSTGPKYV